MTDQTTAPEPTFREQVEQATGESAALPEQSATPEPEEQHEPDQQGEPTVGATEQEKVEKVVPLAALHEERRRRQDMQREMEETRRTLAAMQQQQVAFMQELHRRANPPPTLIDQSVDPIGAMAQQSQMTRQEVAALSARMEAQQREQAEAVTQQRIASSVRAQEAQFAQEHPDYLDAVDYVKRVKRSEYMAAGMSEGDAINAVERDAWQLSQFCLARGVNPAERAYEIAKALQYRPQAKAADKIAMQQAGTKASTPSGGGGQGGGKLPLDALLRMNPKDFLSRTSGDKWRELMKDL